MVVVVVDVGPVVDDAGPACCVVVWILLGEVADAPSVSSEACSSSFFSFIIRLILVATAAATAAPRPSKITNKSI